MVDFRGMGPPQQAAAQLPPSLLQMAQGVAPAMGGDDRGGGLQAFGGDPRDTAQAGPPPAYNPGTAFGGYNAVFDPRAPSSTGGWFSMEDYLNQAPTPMQAAGWGGQSPDGRGAAWGAPTSGGMQSPARGPHEKPYGSNALSTNNWRLLGNDPDMFMINGVQVNRRQAQRELSPRSVMGVEAGGAHPGYRPAGGGQWMMPTGSYAWNQGYIGSDNWATGATPTY